MKKLIALGLFTFWLLVQDGGRFFFIGPYQTLVECNEDRKLIAKSKVAAPSLDGVVTMECRAELHD